MPDMQIKADKPSIQKHPLEQAKNHSADLIEKWLCKYKDWDKRESSGEKVDDVYKQERAAQIASLLGDATEWNSHGRGIPLRVLEWTVGPIDARAPKPKKRGPYKKRNSN